MLNLYRKLAEVAKSVGRWFPVSLFVSALMWLVMLLPWAYVGRVAIGIDQLANAILFGWPDESLSARCGRSIHRYPYKAWAKLIDALFYPFQGPNHCVNAHAKELTRYQFPPSMRGAPAEDEKKSGSVVS